MKIEVETYLKLVEETKTFASFDIEATGLRGDYNSVLVVSIKKFDDATTTFSVTKPGQDKKVVIAAKKELEKYNCIAGYYSSGYDIPMLNTRLLWHGERPIRGIHHIDMYYKLKSNMLTARRSQGHLLSWLGTPDQKMGVSAEKWNEILSSPKKVMPEMIARCESDAAGLEGLYKRTKHLIRDIKVC